MSAPPPPSASLAETLSASSAATITAYQSALDSTLTPKGTRSLSLIALQAFVLGIVLGLCLLIGPWLFLSGSPLWRLPLFLSLLCVFHFLEFWTTAVYNTPSALASSFLLYSNGRAWHIACGAAIAEIVITSLLAPGWQTRLCPPWAQMLALGVCVAGQTLRSLAMCTAGTNFNHIVARAKRESHTLVTGGVYGYVRHPSYAGFFWWSLAGQVLIGNKICTVLYAVVLWRFFSKRIKTEEDFLVQFFGEQYTAYRKRTGTWIPFVR